jgi:hypothetical protein
MTTKTFEISISIRFEARDEAQAGRHVARIMALLEHGSPAGSLEDLGINARFCDDKVNPPVALNVL